MKTATDILSAVNLSVETRSIVRVVVTDPELALLRVRCQANATIWAAKPAEFHGGLVLDVFGRLIAGPFRLFIVRSSCSQ